jgi:uncharacterized cupredoxin-like copper-binding protein
MSVLRRSSITAVLAAAALALSACGGNGADNGNGNGADDGHGDHQTLEVTAREFAFEPDEMRVAADEPVMLVLTNGGAVEHDFVVDEPAVLVHVDPAQTAEEEIGPFPAGTYTVYCSIPGHREAGMEATLVAE